MKNDDDGWEPATRRDTVTIAAFFISVGLLAASFTYFVVSVIGRVL